MAKIDWFSQTIDEIPGEKEFMLGRKLTIRRIIRDTSGQCVGYVWGKKDPVEKHVRYHWLNTHAIVSESSFRTRKEAEADLFERREAGDKGCPHCGGKSGFRFESNATYKYQGLWGQQANRVEQYETTEHYARCMDCGKEVETEKAENL